MLVKSCKHLLGFLLVCTWAMQGHADDDPEKAFTYCTSLPGQKSGYKLDLLTALVAPEFTVKVKVMPEGTAPRHLKLIKSQFFTCDMVIGGPQVGDYTDMERLPVPIMKGLFGTRLLVTTQEKNKLFAKIGSLNELRKKFIIGTGKRWADTALLQANGLNLLPTDSKAFEKMLAGGRVDAYLRSVATYVDFLKNKIRPDHVIADSVALVYPLGSYIYLNPENDEKLAILKKRLGDFVASGEFDKFFYNHPDTKAAMKLLNQPNRKMFILLASHEFYFPKDAPASYWFWNDDRSE